MTRKELAKQRRTNMKLRRLDRQIKRTRLAIHDLGSHIMVSTEVFKDFKDEADAKRD